jgi:hypothetical protein
MADRALQIETRGANRILRRASAAQATGPVAGGGRGDANVVRAFRTAARSMRATRTERLALFEAGIVESGLRNLPYGDRDSVGALQQRPSAGWTGLRNPYRAAVEFLQHARALRPWRGSAGQLAQAVQRSAFPARYDQARAQANRYLARGGRVIRAFAGGGRVARLEANLKLAETTKGKADDRKAANALLGYWRGELQVARAKGKPADITAAADGFSQAQALVSDLEPKRFTRLERAQSRFALAELTPGRATTRSAAIASSSSRRQRLARARRRQPGPDHGGRPGLQRARTTYAGPPRPRRPQSVSARR